MSQGSIKAWGLTLASVSLVCLAGLQAGSQETIDVSGARPLHAMLKEVEKRYGLVVTYEDSPYQSSTESVDVTASRRPDSKKRILTPAGGRFAFTPPGLTAGDSRSRTALIRKLIADFNQSQSNIEYAMSQTGDVFHVFPKQALDRRGQMAPYRPLLDARVSVPPAERTGTQTLSLIFAAVEANRGRHIGDVTPSPSEFDRIHMSIGFDNVEAREAIMMVLAKAARRHSWQLMCQPGDGEACYFSTTPPGVW